MNPMPLKLRKQLREEERMQFCEVCRNVGVEWDHVFMYAGRQIQEAWNIAALCSIHHKEKTMHSGQYVPATRKQVERRAIERAGLDHLKITFPKFNWEQKINELYLKPDLNIDFKTRYYKRKKD